ncbi:MAG TPA: polyphenol oxidase family protein [Acidimicrobiales bacterium]|nr:polyphenol oxidase family protein [Acidimicrobiales bacterium]
MASSEATPPGVAAVREVVEARGHLEVVRLERIAEVGADAIATTRVGGVSAPPYDTLNLGDHVGDDPAAVAENRRRLADAMGVAVEHLAIARQVHGTGVAVARVGTHVGDADVLVTTDDEVAVAILVADCVPIVLCDPDARVLCVVHAGWRGIASSVARVAVRAMSELGARPARCRAAMGPCVSVTAYEVGDDVADALAAVGCATAVVPDGTGRHRADLAGAARAQLVDAGLRAERVDLPTSWTDGGTRFFSDRARRPCGRFALAARLAHAGS